MACTLSNKCAKNLSKRTVLLQLIIKNVVTCFFWNTEYNGIISNGIVWPSKFSTTWLLHLLSFLLNCLPAIDDIIGFWR